MGERERKRERETTIREIRPDDLWLLWGWRGITGLAEFHRVLQDRIKVLLESSQCSYTVKLPF